MLKKLIIIALCLGQAAQTSLNAAAIASTKSNILPMPPVKQSANPQTSTPTATLVKPKLPTLPSGPYKR